MRLEIDAEPGSVWADPDRVEQTLTNLLSNAIKFSSPGGTVRLEARTTGNELWFQVRDQGRGIPAEHLELIFDRFQQVDGSDAREKEGTGLGLAICRTIVEQHGGRIWAESPPGAGATMTITLPVLPPDMTRTTLETAGLTGSRWSRCPTTVTTTRRRPRCCWWRTTRTSPTS